MKSKYIPAVVLLLVAGGATASCLPDPGSIICQDSQGEYHVIPYSEDSMEDSINKTHEAPKSASSSYETSSHSVSDGRAETTNTEYDPKEYFRKYQ